MSDRLSRTEAFRARAWRDLFAQDRVRGLPVGAFKLLVGIVHAVLTPHNNGALTLGPKTLGRIGINGRGGAQQAVDELVGAGLLARTTSGRQGAAVYYALVTLKLEISADRLRKNNLTSSGQVGVTSSGQDPPENLTSSGQDLTSSGQVL